MQFILSQMSYFKSCNGVLKALNFHTLCFIITFFHKSIHKFQHKHNLEPFPLFQRNNGNKDV